MNIPWLCVFLHNRSHSLYQLACGDWLLVYQEILLRQLSCSSDQHPDQERSFPESFLTDHLHNNNRFSIYGCTVPLRRAYFKRVSFLEQTCHRFEINTALSFHTCSQDPFRCTPCQCVWLLAQLCARSVHHTVWTSVSSQLQAQLHLTLQIMTKGPSKQIYDLSEAPMDKLYTVGSLYTVVNIWSGSKKIIRVVLRQECIFGFRTTLMKGFDPLQTLTTVV